jgi:hypothetical protein
MSLLTRILAYLAPNAQSAREHRRANRAEYAAALIAAERRYWIGFLAKAATDADRERAQHELSVLDARHRELRAA